MNTKTITKLTATAAALTSIVVIGNAANAATVSFTDKVNLQQTDTIKTLSSPQFDPSLANLTGVTLELEGLAESSSSYTKAESRGSNNISLDISSQSKTAFDGEVLIQVDPLVSENGDPAILDFLIGTETNDLSANVFTGLNTEARTNANVTHHFDEIIASPPHTPSKKVPEPSSILGLSLLAGLGLLKRRMMKSEVGIM